MEYNEKVKRLKPYRDKYDRLKFIKNQLESELKTTEECINYIPDLNACTTLDYKYLQFKTLSEIADRMNYSISQIKRFHKNGINMILFEPQ